MSHYAAFRRGFHRVHDGEVFGRSRVFVENPHATDFDEVDPPRWFVEDELGAGQFEKTCASLAKRNADALERLGEDAPLRVTYPKNFYDVPRRGRGSAKVIYARRHERGASLNHLLEPGAERAWLPQRAARGESIARGVAAFIRWSRVAPSWPARGVVAFVRWAARREDEA